MVCIFLCGCGSEEPTTQSNTVETAAPNADAVLNKSTKEAVTAKPLSKLAMNDPELLELDIGGIAAVDADSGTINGIVKFAGPQLKRKHIPMNADPTCIAEHGDQQVLRETFIFGRNDTLQNVFVYVSKGLEGQRFDPPTHEVVIDQRGCIYIPHVNAVVAGQSVRISNNDNTAHNVKLQAQINERFNKQQVPGAAINTIFEYAEMSMTLKCDVHNWMKSYVHVLNHPFFAITQENGSFEIRGLPPGKYELTTWHEFAKFKPDQHVYQVTVAEGNTTNMTVTYSP